MNEVLVAVFQTEDAATRAVSALSGAGVPRSSIRRYRRDEYDSSAGMAGSGAAAETRPHQSKGGFWSWLLGEEGGTADYRPEYDRDYESYRSAVEAGRTVLALSVEQPDAHRVLNLLEAQSPVHLEDAGPTNAPGAATAPAPVAPTAARPTAGASAATPGTARGRDGGTEEVIPLAEEHVDIGKRRIESGTTRIRRYVTERPVERQVNLKDEHVEIERRKPVGGTSPAHHAFEERSVEVRDSREEPVVERRTEVGEEVVVRKETRERPETVRTTERKEEVDIARGNKR